MVSKKSKLWITVTMVFLIFMALISVGPLFWVVMSSFKTTKETMKDAFALPQNWNFDGYRVALDISPIFKFYGNSLIISLASTLLNLVVVSLAAYALARFKFKGNQQLTLLFSSSLLIPVSALLMPIYRIWVTLKLFDTRLGLIIVYAALGLPESLFLFKSYFQGIPKELEEAAYLDGAGVFRTFVTIICPLAKSGLATGAILQFLKAWNEFIFALVLTKSKEVRTLPLALNYFTSQFSFNYAAMFAGITMAVLPSILIYVILQEQVTSSMIAGSLKG